MKPIFIFLQVLGLLLTTMNAFAQNFPTAEEFAASTPERAMQILNSTEGMERIEAYVRSAVGSQRLELIKTCFENQYAWRTTHAAIAGLAESSAKDSLTTMMLKSSSHFWPVEGVLVDGSHTASPLMSEPFRGLIKRVMPNLQLSDDLISTHSGRTKLAADLELALSLAGSSPNKQSTIPEAPQVEAPAAIKAATQTNDPPKQVVLPAPTKALNAKPLTEGEEPAASSPWSIIVVLIVAATGLLWLLVKKRK